MDGVVRDRALSASRDSGLERKMSRRDHDETRERRSGGAETLPSVPESYLIALPHRFPISKSYHNFRPQRPSSSDNI